MTDAARGQELNRAWWNERAAFHLDTPLYRTHLARLETGGVSLLPTQLRELGDFTGLHVLHLQCHVSTDTLSLARMGAQVTGVDFSTVAIEQARGLSERLGIPARFVAGESRTWRRPSPPSSTWCSPPTGCWGGYRT